MYPLANSFMDSCGTNSFVDQVMVSQLGLLHEKTSLLKVQLANGQKTVTTLTQIQLNDGHDGSGPLE